MTGVEQPQSVLVIDDAQDIHDLIDVRLRPEGVTIHHALDADTGLQTARAVLPDVILLDLDLAGTSGLDVCRACQTDPVLATIPILFLTGTTDVAVKVKAFDAGAIDYVTKPFDAVELRARVRSALRSKRYLDLLATKAQIDGLTGLWNRAHFDRRLEEAIGDVPATRRPLSLIMADIDHFKPLNDTHGHPFGDTVIRRTADVLASGQRPADSVCRYGGEEFGILLPDTTADEALALAERLRQAVAGLSFAVGQDRLAITLSLGVATAAPGEHLSGGDLLAAADRALYDAKQAGRNRIVTGRPCRPSPPAGRDAV